MQTETQVSEFESLMVLHCNVQNDNFFLFARKNEEKIRERKIINRNHAILGIIKLCIEMMVT